MVIRLLASFDNWYPVSHGIAVQSVIPDVLFGDVKAVIEGSTGNAEMYVGMMAVQRFGKFALLISVAEVLADVTSPGRFPEFDAAYCPIAFNIAFASLFLFVSFACPNCRAGLIAINVIARRIARIPITTRSSINVKPCNVLRFPFLVISFLWAVILLNLNLY